MLFSLIPETGNLICFREESGINDVHRHLNTAPPGNIGVEFSKAYRKRAEAFKREPARR
jgi:hypothetical protein